MNPKFRPLYLILGFANLVWLFYYGYTSFPDYNPIDVLVITIPNMVTLYLAYKTYPDVAVTKVRTKRETILQPEMVNA